ncbi:MAG: SpoIIE family protein phosphatase [Lachnospiraceae bacterium]|nr:SpoIIE family protein phosphatase [Lachnospiraceae bacterium]
MKSYRMGKKIKYTVILLIVMILFARPAIAACSAESSVPVWSSGGYSDVLYNNRNGLSTSEANDIAQTEDGFIWIGSYSGLTRYDGNTFERMDSTTGVANVGCLFVDSLDRLWIGTNDSGLAMMERGEIRHWKKADGMGSDKISDITQDTDGMIYAATVEGIQFIGEDFTLHNVEDSRISGMYVESLVAGKDGKLYGMSSDDDIFVLQDGKVISYISSADNSLKGIVCIRPDDDHPGKAYFGTEDSRFFYGSVSRDRLLIEKELDIAPLFGVMDIEQINGRIWICGRNGIGVIESGKFYYLEDLAMKNSVGNVIADYEGNLWFTSTRQGVMKIVPNRFVDLFEKYELPETVVNSTCISGDKLFIGTDTGLIVLDEKGRVGELPLTGARSASGTDLEESDLLQMLDGCRVRSIIRDSKGRIWISTWRACGLLCYDGGTVTAFTDKDGLVSNHVRMVYEREDGSFLAVSSGGVSVIEDGRVTGSYTAEDGIVNPESLTVSENAANGDILLGSNGGGIYVIGKNGTRCIGTEDGLTSGIVMRIKRDPARDLYWIITSNSIAFMTSDYQLTTVSSFPYSNNFDLYENDKGDMWILSSDGIYVLPTEELLKGDNLKPVHYGLANGLPSIATSNSYSELTEDGDLYISGNLGVSKVNINSSMETTADLKVSVPYIDVDGIRTYPDAQGGFRISSDVQKVTIYSYVYNYSLTDPKVAYQLKGFDREAVVVSRTDLNPVDYTNLPGGSYQFEIRVMDSMGRGGRTISVPIVKEKAVYEEKWFIVLFNLALIFTAGLLVMLYYRRKTRLLEERNKEEVKKERLKTELNMASQIQSGMLVHDFPPVPGRDEFDIYAVMDPAREVGGDFYDIFMIDDDHLCMVIADVSGKGIPGALFMMVSKVIVQSCAMLGASAGEILTKTNEAICSNNKHEMFITVWVGILEISTGIISAANAGHEYPAIRRRNGEFSILKDKHGLVIGAMEDTSYSEYEIAMEPGDKLFVYTDGVPEAADKKDNMFGLDRMIDALNKDADAAPRKLLENVMNAVDAFVKDAEQFDDITMLCVEYKGKNSL